MKIQSKFSDYYDKHQIYHNTYIFNRNILTSKIPEGWTKIDRYLLGGSIIRVGFCGKIYNGVFIPAYDPEKDAYIHRVPLNQRVKTEARFIYSFDEYLEYITESRRFYRGISTDRKKELSNFFSTKSDNTLFIEKNSPVFIMHQYQWPHNNIQYQYCLHFHTMGRTKINALDIAIIQKMGNAPFTLKYVHFDQVIPSHIAFMEIESYISGVLTREHKEIPEMDNDTKIALHGMSKTSFCRKKI